ncbi:MAG: hypothetical protein H8D05_00880 [FCB group bacterium]|nr:hypothetical protein [FCB group bacterium]
MIISLAILLIAGIFIWRLEREQRVGITSMKQLEKTLEKEGFTITGRESGWLFCKGHGLEIIFGTDETDTDFVRLLVPFGDEELYLAMDPFPLNRESKLAKLVRMEWESNDLLCAAVDLLRPTKAELRRAIYAGCQLGDQLKLKEEETG